MPGRKAKIPDQVDSLQWPERHRPTAKLDLGVRPNMMGELAGDTAANGWTNPIGPVAAGKPARLTRL